MIVMFEIAASEFKLPVHWHVTSASVHGVILCSCPCAIISCFDFILNYPTRALVLLASAHFPIVQLSNSAALSKTPIL